MGLGSLYDKLLGKMQDKGYDKRTLAESDLAGCLRYNSSDISEALKELEAAGKIKRSKQGLKLI